MRVQVNLNDNIVKQIDEYAAAIGMNRSQCCAYWIGQAVLSLNKSLDVLEQMGFDMSEAIQARDEQQSSSNSSKSSKSKKNGNR